ncbi:hypothetical protein H0266_14945 [Halobacillus locisalis]|uniref:Uncharacterized protein n=1 Tax=Halobacillus locisalis TaxID=220753 RepID=A0A838CVL9_9BACI|nr:hypothetical protein [Halobacillus locisalis]MBA2176192.1 hypothetical protein [Halobacillus locisalis]
MLKSPVLNFSLSILLLFSAAHDIDRIVSDEGWLWLNIIFLVSSIAACVYFFWAGIGSKKKINRHSQ